MSVEVLVVDDEPQEDIHTILHQYDQEFFGGKLGGIEIKWSSNKMITSAGVFRCPKDGSPHIVISKPLLSLRPSIDLHSIIVHEMIHAYLYINGETKKHDEHDEKFEEMAGIFNAAAEGRFKVTKYHGFKEEVKSYHNHIWQCRECGNTVRKASSKAIERPCEMCNGQYQKISEPNAKRAKKSDDDDWQDARRPPDIKKRPPKRAKAKKKEAVTDSLSMDKWLSDAPQVVVRAPKRRRVIDLDSDIPDINVIWEPIYSHEWPVGSDGFGMIIDYGDKRDDQSDVDSHDSFRLVRQGVEISVMKQRPRRIIDSSDVISIASSREMATELEFVVGQDDSEDATMITTQNDIDLSFIQPHSSKKRRKT